MLNKKLLWSAAALVPLVIAPVAVVASCSTTLTAAQAMAEKLEQEPGKVSFKDANNEFSATEIQGYISTPADLMKRLTINLNDSEKAQFDVSVDSVSGAVDNDTKLAFKLKVKDKNTNEEATTKDIKLDITLKNKPASEKVQAAVKATNDAYTNKTFKVKDQLTLTAAHLDFMNGLSDPNNKLDMIEKANELLQHVFEGYNAGDQDVKLSIAKFSVAKKTKAQAKATLTLRLKYSDAQGQDATSALTDEFRFDDVQYDDQYTVAGVIQVLDVVFGEQKWLKFKNDQGYSQDQYTRENLVKPEFTNYQEMLKKFLPNAKGFQLEIPQDSFSATPVDNNAKMKVSFKIKVTKGSDGSDTQTTNTAYEYTHPIKK